MIIRHIFMDEEADASGEGGGSGGGSEDKGEKPNEQQAKPDTKQEPPPIPADSKAPDDKAPKPDSGKDGADIARLEALINGLATQMSGLVEANTATRKQADDQAKENRKQAMAAALDKAEIDAGALKYARQDLGDLDLSKEADAAKLSKWVESHAKFFAKKGGAGPAPDKPSTASKKHWLADHMTKMFGGG